MRSVVHLISRVILSLALTVAILPVQASQGFCVMPNRAPVPIATCGMPCCAHLAKTAPEAVRPSCCNQGKPSKAPAPTKMGAGCRCEMQVRVTSSPPAAPSPQVSLTHAQAAILTAPRLEGTPTAAAVLVPDPPIIGADSSPPAPPPASDPPDRAPPPR